MRLYKVSMNGDFGDADGRSYWTARKSEIGTLRRRLKDECNDPETRGMGGVETVDSPVTKDGILSMLNRFAVAAGMTGRRATRASLSP